MPKNADDKKAKLTLRIEVEDGETAEIVIEGASNIAYFLYEAGIFNNELAALLGYS